MLRLSWLLGGLSLAVIGVIGCGGAGGGGFTDGGPTTDTGGASGGGIGETREGTALFHVDLERGDVRITDLKPESRATFAGGAVSFLSSTVSEQGGNTGRKLVSVRLRNNLNEAIGVNSPGPTGGLRVYFQEFRNINSGDDLRVRTVVSTLAGAGAQGYTDGPSSSALFRRPGGVAVGQDGTVYVADSENHRIRVIRNGQVRTLAGNGTAARVDGLGTVAAFNRPFAIASSPSGDLFVAEQGGNVIRRVTPEGAVSTIAGTGTAGSANGGGNVATFNAPEGIAIAPNGDIIVSDTGNNRLRLIVPPVTPSAPASAYSVSTLAGSGAAGFADGNGAGAIFNAPRGVTVAPDGNIYVADKSNHRIRRVSPSGQVVTVAGNGSTGFADGAGDTARFVNPSGIVALSQNALLVAEQTGRRIRQITLPAGAPPNNAANWNVNLVAGTSVTGSTDGAGDVATFNAPHNITIDGNELILADYNANNIRKVSALAGFPIPDEGGTPTTELVRIANANNYTSNEKPYVQFPSLQPGETSAAKEWAFIVPPGVKAFEFVVVVEGATSSPATLDAVLNTTSSLVGSPNNWVRILSGAAQQGNVGGTLQEARYNWIAAMAVDSAGNIYFVDYSNYMIRRIGTDGRVTRVAGTGSTGHVDGPGHTATFRAMGGIAVEPSGKVVYVTDAGHIIRRIEQTGADPARADHWTVNTIAGLAVTSGDAVGSGTDSRFRTPWGMTRTQGGNLYITELAGNRVREITHIGGSPTDPSNWRTRVVAGSLAADVGYVDSTTGTAVRFNSPIGITCDAFGNLYVCDSNNLRIRKVSLTGATTTFAGGGPTPRDGPLGTGRITPWAVTIDPAGYLYVTDYMSVRRVSPTGMIETAIGGGAYGTGIDSAGNVHSIEDGSSILYLPSGDLLIGDFRRLRLVSRVLTK